MAKCGDSYTITLNDAQLKWGTYRHTASRPVEIGEAYIPIPAQYAKQYKIYNGNHTNDYDVLGENLFNAYDADTKQFIDHFKAQGSSNAGSEYAKQFSIAGNLKALGKWLSSKNAHNGTQVTITWTSPEDIMVKVH